MNTIFYIEKKIPKNENYDDSYFWFGKSGSSCKNREIGYFHVINLNIHTVIKISVSAPDIIESMPGVGQQPQPSHKSTRKQNVRTNNALLYNEYYRKSIKNSIRKPQTKLPKSKTLMSLNKVMNR